jgi:hypothetical protein
LSSFGTDKSGNIAGIRNVNLYCESVVDRVSIRALHIPLQVCPILSLPINQTHRSTALLLQEDRTLMSQWLGIAVNNRREQSMKSNTHLQQQG